MGHGQDYCKHDMPEYSCYVCKDETIEELTRKLAEAETRLSGQTCFVPPEFQKELNECKAENERLKGGRERVLDSNTHLAAQIENMSAELSDTKEKLHFAKQAAAKEADEVDRLNKELDEARAQVAKLENAEHFDTVFLIEEICNAGICQSGWEDAKMKDIASELLKMVIQLNSTHASKISEAKREALREAAELLDKYEIRGATLRRMAEEIKP